MEHRTLNLVTASLGTDIVAEMFERKNVQGVPERSRQEKLYSAK